MDVQKIRADFPILQKKVKGKPFIYFDNSCVTLKPKQVIDAEMAYYTDYTACHGRSVHYFAQRTTEEFKKAHSSVAKLVGANENEIVITKNTTEAINTVSNGLDWKPGDRVLTTKMEHNSNLIPWMKLARDRGVEHDYVEVDAEGQLDLEDLKRQLGRKTKLVSIVYTSNVTGATIDAREVAKIAHDYGALILLDAAQTVNSSAELLAEAVRLALPTARFETPCGSGSGCVTSTGVWLARTSESTATNEVKLVSRP